MKGARHRMRATTRNKARHNIEGARRALTPPQPRFVLRPPLLLPSPLSFLLFCLTKILTKN